MNSKNTISIAFSGWLVAAFLGTLLLTGGFQNTGTKIGVVDMNRVLQDSNSGKKAREDVQTQFNLRQGLLEFVNTQKVLTVDQANRLKELTLKPNPTEGDRQALEQLKASIQADARRFNDLMVKPNPTETDRQALTEFNQRRNNSDAILRAWNEEFSNDLTNLQDDMFASVLTRARQAVLDHGRREGFSVVFPSNVAIYGANDVTEAIVKAVDAR